MSHVIAATTVPGRPVGVDRLPAWITAALAGAVALTTLLGNGSLVAAVAPILLAVLAGLLWVAPLRVSLGLVMFVGLAVDRPGDTDGFWASPFVTVGGLLFHNLNHVVPVDALKFSGVFAMVAVLLMVRFYRRLVGRVRDTADSVVMASPMSAALAAAALTVGALVAFGAVRGGGVQSAKVQVPAFLQLTAVAYLFGVSLPLLAILGLQNRLQLGWLFAVGCGFIHLRSVFFLMGVALIYLLTQPALLTHVFGAANPEALPAD